MIRFSLFTLVSLDWIKPSFSYFTIVRFFVNKTWCEFVCSCLKFGRPLTNVHQLLSDENDAYWHQKTLRLEILKINLIVFFPCVWLLWKCSWEIFWDWAIAFSTLQSNNENKLTQCTVFSSIDLFITIKTPEEYNLRSRWQRWFEVLMCLLIFLIVKNLTVRSLKIYAHLHIRSSNLKWI